MAIVVADRVCETTATTGTGTLTLAGAVPDSQAFSVVPTGSTVFYCVTDNVSAWEVGEGVYTTSGTTLTRATVFSSSNSNALVSFAAGTKNVFLTIPAARLPYLDDNTSLTTNWLQSSCCCSNQVTNLSISAGGSNATATVTFDECLLKSSTGIFLATSAAAGTININASNGGANGLDTGTIAPNEWLYLFIIYNGTTIAGLASLSRTAPTMPSGYTYKALIGVVRVGADIFQGYNQIGKQIYIQLSVTGNPVVSAQHTNNVWTSVNPSSILPPIAKSVSGFAGAAATSTICGVAIAADGSGTGEVAIAGPLSSSNIDNLFVGGYFTIPITTSQTFYYKTFNATGTQSIWITGYTIELQTT